ncbi:MAG: PEP-CTERM sorting domain-containing protein [Acidobacteria bacterium]|nr:PEP-CTERM sorting domain-containing protein [Acidobacteriota bacterium]
MKNLTAMIVTAAALLTPASASIIFTHEAAGVQYTTVAGAITETFDSASLGAFSGASAIGTYSAGGVINSGNAWGGSNQTNHIDVGAQSGTTDYSIDFGKNIYYFGFYWGAGDAQNEIQFYQGLTKVASFKVGDISGGLSSAYWGNPNNGQNQGEPYVYLNFTADSGTPFDKVVFHNNGTGTGYETDSHSIYDQPINPPGVPEPATWAMMAGAAVALVALKRRS